MKLKFVKLHFFFFIFLYKLINSTFSNKNKNFVSVISLQISPGAVVCVEADIKGDVTIGAKTIVHPCAKIFATNGPIVIGDCNIIEELAEIENKTSETLVIGNNNVFEIDCKVYAKAIGDHNIFEPKCLVGEELKIGNGCVFSATTQITSNNSIPDNSVFFGNPLRHRIAGERPPAQNLQIDFLARILPNYHHVKNPKDNKKIEGK